MFPIYRTLGAIGLSAACLSAVWSQPSIARTAPRPNAISYLFQHEPISSGPVAYKLIVLRQVPWELAMAPFGSRLRHARRPATPWNKTSTRTTYLNLDTASKSHPTMAYRLRWLHFSLTVSGEGAGYQNLIVKSPPHTTVSVTEYGHGIDRKVVKPGDVVTNHDVILQSRKPVAAMKQSGQFSVFRVESWINGLTYVRVKEMSGRARRTMALAWETYQAFRPPYQVKPLPRVIRRPRLRSVHQLAAVRMPAITHLASVAVTKLGLVFSQTPGDTLWLWPWAAQRPRVVMKSWPPMMIDSGIGAWVDGTTLQIYWQGAEWMPLWVEWWNLATGWHHLLALIGARYPTEPSQTFGSPAYQAFGYPAKLWLESEPRHHPVRLPRGLISILGYANKVLGDWNGRYGLYNWERHSFVPLKTPAAPAAGQTLGAILWGTLGPTWVYSPIPTKPWIAPPAATVTLEAASGKNRVTWKLPADESLSLGLSFLVRVDRKTHQFWIAWNAPENVVHWHYGGPFRLLWTLGEGIVWTTKNSTWIWRADHRRT